MLLHNTSLAILLVRLPYADPISFIESCVLIKVSHMTYSCVLNNTV